jgi:phosphoglycerate dehydrogenase-like enzyme
MSSGNAICRIAIVGTGVIGASRAALFLAHDLEVVATDPAPNAERILREYVETPGLPLKSWSCFPMPLRDSTGAIAKG